MPEMLKQNQDPVKSTTKFIIPQQRPQITPTVESATPPAEVRRPSKFKFKRDLKDLI
jgi:hypothetical protein